MFAYRAKYTKCSPACAVKWWQQSQLPVYKGRVKQKTKGCACVQVGAALASLLALGGDAVTRRGDVVSAGCRALEAEHVYSCCTCLFGCHLPCCMNAQACAYGAALRGVVGHEFCFAGAACCALYWVDCWVPCCMQSGACAQVACCMVWLGKLRLLEMQSCVANSEQLEALHMSVLRVGAARRGAAEAILSQVRFTAFLL